MTSSLPRLSDILHQLGEPGESARVEISYDTLRILSEQLYATPSKAIEELVVNSWDADAQECHVIMHAGDGAAEFVAVLDNGHGLSLAEIKSLWRIGWSEKRSTERRRKPQRRQIGKFGIGKLASYVIAERITYLTRSGDGFLGATLDFTKFRSASKSDGTTDPVVVDIRRLGPADLARIPQIEQTLSKAGLSQDTLSSQWESWTVVLLEDLRPKLAEVTDGRLRWVLATAMPLQPGFELRLDGQPVVSALAGKATWIVDFQVDEVEPKRLEDLNSATGDGWTLESRRLINRHFPEGVTGRVRVARNSLYSAGTKSEDLGRSYGFFVKVRGRLVAESDPLFGLKPLSFSTLYNLHAEIEAGDLDEFITAPRQILESSPAKDSLRNLLNALFNQARSRYDEKAEEWNKQQRNKVEDERYYTSPLLLERPIADALVGRPVRSWLTLRASIDEEHLSSIVEDLYADVRKKYSYSYDSLGVDALLIKLDAESRSFILNDDHEVTIEYKNDVRARRLLELFGSAESMLEVYLKEFGIGDTVIDDVMNKRDRLLRGLAKEDVVALSSIAHQLRTAKDDPKALEIAVVGAARSLGFSAKHVSGPGEPDGTARYTATATGVEAFTLEAKSSKDVPSLANLDFGGLRSHWDRGARVETRGCLLVAPRYPDGVEVSRRAVQNRVSCWTIEQLASIVESAEARRLNAHIISGIVLRAFKPEDVAKEVAQLLGAPTVARDELYRRILRVLRQLEPQLPNSARRVDTVAGALAVQGDVPDTQVSDIREALLELAKGSRGLLHVADDDELVVRGSLDELSRRVQALTGEDAPPRRESGFRNGPANA